MKNLLQTMYDSANWYGYSPYKGKRCYAYQINRIADRLNINLKYNCYA